MKSVVVLLYISLYICGRISSSASFIKDSYFHFDDNDIRIVRGDTNYKFGYQNPILVAPTSSPRIITSNKPTWSIPTFWDQSPDYYDTEFTHTTRRPTTGFYDNDARFTTRRNMASTLKSTTKRYYDDETTWKSTTTPTENTRPSTLITTSKVLTPKTTIKTQSPCDLKSPHFRLDLTTNKCIRLGETSICRSNMAFYPVENNPIYGDCNCIKEPSRPLVYHPETDVCYFIFQQAYCGAKNWLTISPSGDPECNPNPCHQYGESELNWDWTANSNMTFMDTEGIVPIYDVQKCVPLGFQCYYDKDGMLQFPDRGSSPPADGRNGIIAFQPGHVMPTCHTHNRTLMINLRMGSQCSPDQKQCLSKSLRTYDMQSVEGNGENAKPHFETLPKGSELTNAAPPFKPLIYFIFILTSGNLFIFLEVK